MRARARAHVCMRARLLAHAPWANIYQYVSIRTNMYQSGSPCCLLNVLWAASAPCCGLFAQRAVGYVLNVLWAAGSTCCGLGLNVLWAGAQRAVGCQLTVLCNYSKLCTFPVLLGSIAAVWLKKVLLLQKGASSCFFFFFFFW